MAAAVALGAVADLVVVLEIAEEARSRYVRSRRAPVGLPPELRVAAVVDVRLTEGGGDVGQRSEIGVVPLALAGERGVHGVVEVVAPLRVEAVAAVVACPYQARVVAVALGDH